MARAAAHQLEDVRVALLRHDRGAGGHRRRQARRSRIRRVAKSTQVGGEPPEVLHQQRDLEEHLRLGLAARQLHGGHRLVDAGEAEAARGSPRGRPAGAARRSRRPSRAGSSSIRREQAASPCGVVAQLGREAAGPQRHRARHRLLHVGVAGERRSPPRAAARPSSAAATLAPPRRERRDRVAQIEPQRGEHLVVARAPEMDARAGLADPLPSAALSSAVWTSSSASSIRHSPAACAAAERREPVADRGEVGRRQQPGRREHLGVGDRGADVVGRRGARRARGPRRRCSAAPARRAARPCPTAGSCRRPGAPPAPRRLRSGP